MNALTRRQQQILDFIQQQQQLQGETPTRREIAGHFAFASPNAVNSHLRLLIKKGVLRSEKGRARSLRVLSPLEQWRGPVSHIPVFGSIPAGFAEAREADAEGCVTVDVTTIGYKPTKNSFALRVSGQSMIGRHILDGDLVILEHGPEPRPGDVVAALIDGNCTLKTYVVKGGKPYLRAENPKYPDLIPARELVIQGVMRALIRPVHG
ncbi:MAG TPA: transcriptional repressor LexA [Candidatus Angelobacter sp.]|jgi:repressor LexA|nr:transcriptional repressor LexA [Candidatus Angelobacter sp.]